ncbi:MAG TPA: hypothetical protein VN541_20250 [Tepidisphaeraceae bacterium]|nr:hypothetical protein [Tepidisphaeraceae bacterium]
MFTLLLLAVLPLKINPVATAPNVPATNPTNQARIASAESPAAAIEAKGYIEPVDPLEVRIRPRLYSGELTIAYLAANGSKVKKGEVLLQIDPAPLDRQLSAARNEAIVAHAAMDRAQGDAQLGREQDELALRIQTDATRDAHDAIKWFETVDGPNMLQGVDVELKNARASVEDQQDELDELKKMYKSQDLTTDTADIVVKRAVRRLEVLKVELKMTQDRAEKTKTFTYPNQRQHVLDAAKQADQQLQALKIGQAQSKVTRDTGLVSARAAVDAADRKVTELRNDRDQLAVRAPTDGVVYYGQFENGAFSAIAREALRSGERISAQQVVMTFFTPGKVRLHLDLPADKFFRLPPNAKGTITLDALAGQKLEGVCEPALPIDVNTAEGTQFIPMYHVSVGIADPNEKLIPGLRATFRAPTAETQEASASEPHK